MPMGFFRKPIRQSFSLCLLLAGLAEAAPPPMPDYLPEPPPLPPEMLDKRPLQPPPDLPDPSVLFAQLKQLEELLSLPPEKLVSLRQTIEYIEKLGPEEREAMRLRLTQITRVTPELREEIDSMATFLPADLHSNLSQFWLAASPTERENVRSQLASLPDPKKTALLSSKVEAFVQRREELFAKMKASLENRKQNAGVPPP